MQRNSLVKPNVLLDKDAKYERFFSIVNVAIIKTNRGRIIDVKIFNLYNIESKQ